jgi:hypothetical protein
VEPSVPDRACCRVQLSALSSRAAGGGVAARHDAPIEPTTANPPALPQMGRLLAAALAVAVAVGGAAPVCRDRFLRPFDSVTSVWNHPIGSDAVFAPAGIYSTLGPPASFHNDQVGRSGRWRRGVYARACRRRVGRMGYQPRAVGLCARLRRIS